MTCDPHRVWREHRLWLGGLVAALVLGGAVVWGLGQSAARINAKTVFLQKARKEALRARQTLETDTAAARDLESALSPDKVKSLVVPPARRAYIAQVQDLASRARLSALTYTLSPPVRDGGALVDVSTLTLSANAPLDTDARAFWDRLQAMTSGKLDMETLTLTRAGPAALSLHLSIRYRWTVPAAPEKGGPS